MIDDKIITAIRQNKAVPIIGAGVSYFYGYPNWRDLLIKLSVMYNANLNHDMINGKDYLQVAEALLQKGINDRNLSSDQIKVFIEEFNTNVIECFKKGYDKNNENQNEINKIKRLNDIKFRTVITTNYDDLLESEIFKDNRYSVIYPSVGKELSFDEYMPCIMKIHGDISESKSIILTQSQYYDFINSKGYFNSKIYTLFTTNIIIMIGYSFRDINIHEIYFKYRNEFKEYIKDIPKAYMLVTDYDITEMGKEYYELYKVYLKGNGIEVIDGYETIGDFIGELVNKVNEDKRKWNAYKYIQFDNNTNITCEILDSIIGGKKVSLNQVDTDKINLTIAKELITLVSMMLGKPLELDEFNGRWSGNLDAEGKLSSEVCEELFELIKICVKNENEIADMEQFGEIVAYSLEYADEFRSIKNDFYIYPIKFEIFIDLVKYVKKFNLSNDLLSSFTMNFSNVLNYSGTERGKCNGSAKLLESNFSNIPSVVFKVYFRLNKENVMKEIREYINDGANENFAWFNYKLFHNQELYWLENKFSKSDALSPILKEEIIYYVNDINEKAIIKKDSNN